MLVLKHQQLAEATTRVELLTRELAISSQQQNIKLPHHLHGNNGRSFDHGMLKEHIHLRSRSWQNDDENDTETSADSGHVSNDSPSYQHRLAPGFQFFPSPPDMYSGKMENFELHSEFDRNVKPYPSERFGLYDAGVYHGFDGQTNHHHLKLQQLQNTLPGEVGVKNLPRQYGTISPPSSLSSMYSESSRSESFLSNSMDSTLLSLGDDSSTSSVHSRSSTPTNNRKQVLVSPNSAEMPDLRHSAKFDTSSSKHSSLHPNNMASDDLKRTAGSISLYHRNRTGSLDNNNCKKTEVLHQQSQSAMEQENIPPNNTFAPEKSNVSSSVVSLSLARSSKEFQPNHSLKLPSSPVTLKDDAVKNNHFPRPTILDLPKQNSRTLPQQGITRKKSPLSQRKFTPPGDYVHDTKVFYSAQRDTTSSPANFSHSRDDRKMLTGSTNQKEEAKNVACSTKKKSDSVSTEDQCNSEGLEMSNITSLKSDSLTRLSSPEIKGLLHDMSTFKMTMRDVKPIQIQTKAEKDSDNNPTSKQTEIATTTSAENPSRRTFYKPPKPVPRKRTKTPPLRASASQSSQNSQQILASELIVKDEEKNVDNMPNLTSKNEDRTLDLGLGNKAYDSILRSSKHKGNVCSYYLRLKSLYGNFLFHTCAILQVEKVERE